MQSTFLVIVSKWVGESGSRQCQLTPRHDQSTPDSGGGVLRCVDGNCRCLDAHSDAHQESACELLWPSLAECRSNDRPDAEMGREKDGPFSCQCRLLRIRWGREGAYLSGPPSCSGDPITSTQAIWDTSAANASRHKGRHSRAPNIWPGIHQAHQQAVFGAGRANTVVL